MQAIILGLFHVLLISNLLDTSEGITAGCADWTLGKNGSVCCKQCKPGNRLLKQCGEDPAKLCTPCEPNTYTQNPLDRMCNRCKQCTGIQVEVRPCNASSDTVCVCKPGLRCGDESCTYCVDECKKGEEPTTKRSCRKCPEGTFNDKIHSQCKAWSKSCPNGEKLIEKGDAFKDIKCSGIQITSSTVKIPPVGGKAEGGMFWPLLGILGISVLLGIVILSLWLLVLHKTKSSTENKKSQPELTVIMVEPDEACSFHCPEQEQGGSRESISTQGSDIKLIV